MTRPVRPVRDDQHGLTGYQYGCRCDVCREANKISSSQYRHGESFASDCIDNVGIGKGNTSRCIMLAGQLARAETEFRNVARLANRSERSFDKHRDALAEAKAARDFVRGERDAHMALCDAAAVRFGAA